MKKLLQIMPLFLASMLVQVNLTGKPADNADLLNPPLPSVSFQKKYINIVEDGGAINVNLTISVAGAVDASVDVSLLEVVSTAIEGEDFTFTNATYTFPASSTTSITISVPVIDNDDENIDKLFVFKLSNPVNCQMGSNKDFVGYILDDEATAPSASHELEIEFASSYLVDAEGSAEIVTYNKPLKRLYVMNSTRSRIEILNFSNPKAITTIATVDLAQYGSGGTSVACNNAIVAATITGNNYQNGRVVFMNKNGKVLKVVTVGAGPDMITFTPDNHYVLVANEGEPNSDYSIDPEGSITIIDITGGVENIGDDDVVNIDFKDFDDDKAPLQAAGVRIFGLNSTVSQDFEPEYITVSENSQQAWVSLQENNAFATINLMSKTVTNITPLGLKDHSLAQNTLDVSDKNDSVFMSIWPNLKGMYLPDAMACYSVNGVNYLVTANEGDQRDYDAINEDVKVKDVGYVLDPATFADADVLKKDHMLGRLAVTPYSGDTDHDGDYDEIHAFGARSFSIRNAETGAMVFDSGDDFEKITAADPVFGKLFNASNDNNSFKNRSDNKGPEPEGVTIAKISDHYFAFITLERIGGFMTYEITNPEAPVFVDYNNSRMTGTGPGGDLGPEGIIYVNPNESPVDTGLVVIANEISATISVYYITNDVKKGTKSGIDEDLAGNGGDNQQLPSDLKIYPNPAAGQVVYFSRPVSFSLYNTSGRKMIKEADQAMMDISQLENGVYLIVINDGSTRKLVVNR
jgi:hypothetical protein